MAEYIDRNLIEWYGCDFENADCENRECSVCSHAECSHSQVMQIPIANVIPIPEGATNGDMIKAMFPDCKDWKARLEDNDGEVYEVHFVQLPNSMTVNKYEESWWNAPYRKAEE